MLKIFLYTTRATIKCMPLRMPLASIALSRSLPSIESMVVIESIRQDHLVSESLFNLISLPPRDCGLKGKVHGTWMLKETHKMLVNGKKV